MTLMTIMRVAVPRMIVRMITDCTTVVSSKMFFIRDIYTCIFVDMVVFFKTMLDIFIVLQIFAHGNFT
jgi:hypothetical protein